MPLEAYYIIEQKLRYSGSDSAAVLQGGDRYSNFNLKCVYKVSVRDSLKV